MPAIPFGKWCMIGLVVLLLCEQAGQAEGPVSKARVIPAHQAERHLKNIRQLTVGRQNAEAYFSFSGDKLIFQSTNNWTKDTHAVTLTPADAGLGCYQMYVMDLGSDTVHRRGRHDVRIFFSGRSPHTLLVDPCVGAELSAEGEA